MAKTCKCDYVFANTGKPNCTPVHKALKLPIIVPLYKDDGTPNKVDPNDTLDKAWIEARINDPDPSARWYPLPEMVNVDPTRPDANWETFDNGQKFYVGENPRHFMGILAATAPYYKGIIESGRCSNNLGIQFFDVAGNLVLLGNDDGFGYPMPINGASLYGKADFGTDKKTTQVAVEFDFDGAMNDADITMITRSAFTGFNPLSIRGLVDVKGVVSNITTTGFRLKLTAPGSSLNDVEAVKKLLLANFVLKEKTPTPGTISITSVTEIEDGLYAFVYAAQTSGDKLFVTPSRNGLDCSEIPNIEIEIP